MIRKFLPQLLLILFSAVLSFAQPTEEKPVLIDEIGAVNMEDLMARIDNAIISSHIDSFSKITEARLKIRIEGGVNSHYSTAYGYASLITGHITRNRAVSLSKFSIDFCKSNDEFKIQFFSHNVNNNSFPACLKDLEIPKKTTLIETIGSDYPQKELLPAESSIIDIGPDEGKYSMFALNTLSQLLKKLSGSKVVVIGYLNANAETQERKGNRMVKKNMDKKSEISNLFRLAKNLLTKYKVNPQKIQFIDGGYSRYSKVWEFWFIPPNGEIPQPKPDYFPKVTKLSKSNLF